MDKSAPPPGFHPHAPSAYPPPDYSGPSAQPYAQVPTAPGVTIVTGPLLGPTSSVLQCPACHQTVQTSVVRKASGKTHLIALLLCLFQCWICIPCVYCSDSLQDLNHHCPNCNTYLGTYSSL